MSWYSDGEPFDEQEPEYCKYCEIDDKTYEWCRECEEAYNESFEDDEYWDVDAWRNS